MKIYINNETKAVAKFIPDDYIIEEIDGIRKEIFNAENNGETVIVESNIYWANTNDWSVIENINEADLPDPFVPHMYKYENGVFSTVIDGWVPEPIPDSET